MRPRVIVSNVASMDGRLTLAPGVNLMAGDERWTAMMGDLGDPYARVRATHDPQVLLEGSGSLLNPVGVETVVCTGGGRLGGALLRQDLVDEIDVELLPWAVGGRGTPKLFDAAPLAPGEWPTRLELLSCDVVSQDRVRLRYGVVR